MSSKRSVQAIFSTLLAIYGSRWSGGRDAGGADHLVALWSRVLADIDDEGVRLGILKLERSTQDWPPTPGQFLAMCRPEAEAFDMPDPQVAFRLATTSSASHGLPPIVWHAQQETGAYALKHSPEGVMFPRFKAIYESLVHRARQGERFDYPAYIVRKIGPPRVGPRLVRDRAKGVTA